MSSILVCQAYIHKLSQELQWSVSSYENLRYHTTGVEFTVPNEVPVIQNNKYVKLGAGELL